MWLTIPSARPSIEANPVLQAWRDMGYKIALWRDVRDESEAGMADSFLHGPYPGYAVAVNLLIKQIMDCCDPEAQWFVAGGDDTLPDPTHRGEMIAEQCCDYFYKLNSRNLDQVADQWDTFGVMQPTGDRFAGGQIDRICGSPWIGREFARRINQGRGPFWPEYFHMWVDEEMQHVSKKYGVLWQRPDLVHLHRQFMRESDAIDSPAVAVQTPEGIRYGGDKKPRPAFLDEANSREHWQKYETLFKNRRAAGFPGSEPL